MTEQSMRERLRVKVQGVVKLRKALKRRAAEYRKGQADGTD